MAEVEVEIPDSWITEWNVLYVIARTYERPERLAERANASLAEWDYPFRLTPLDFWPARLDVLWVDPAHIAEEQWPTSAFTRNREQGAGWIRVLRFDLEEITDRTIRTEERSER